jgi:hypothetical protein
MSLHSSGRPRRGVPETKKTALERALAKTLPLVTEGNMDEIEAICRDFISEATGVNLSE